MNRNSLVPRTVLIVDDDPDTCDAICRIAERAGISCLAAKNGVDALCILQTNRVQVILTDHDMPMMDGIELLKMVATRHPLVCRILLTGRRDAEPAVRAVNVGRAYRVLTKPCRTADLLTTLHFAFEVSDTESENRRLAAQLQRQSALLAELRRRMPTLVEEVVLNLSPEGA